MTSARTILAGVFVLACAAPALSQTSPPGRSSPQRPESAGRLVEQLALLVEQGQLARARELVNGALRQHPSSAPLHEIAGVIEAADGAYTAAERHFRAAIAADPAMASAYLSLGRLYQEHAHADPDGVRKARDVYDALLRKDPRNAEAWYQTAYLAAVSGEWPRSQAALSRLPPGHSRRPQVLAVSAVTAAGLGDEARAASLAGELLAHPDLTDEDVRAVLPALRQAKADALLLRLLGGLDQRGLAGAESLRELGLAYARQQRFADARAALERAARSAAANRVPLLLDAARAAYDQADFEGALAYLAEAREIEPQNARVHFMFGLSCVGLDLGSEAYESLKKAVALAPDNPYVNYAMGAVAIHRHDPSEAIPYFERYVALQPADPRGRFALGAARFYSNDFDGARKDLELAVRAPETAAGAHYFLGRIARQLDDPDRARQEIDRALALNPQHADSWAELGLLQLRKGEYAQSEASLKRALSLEPDNHAATVNLAALYARTKDPRREEQAARVEALQQKRAAAAQEFLRMIQVVR